MAEYIERQAAIDALDGIFDNVPMELTTEILRLRRELRGLSPAEDVVPVVRCKNCKHHAYDEIFSCYWCEYPGRVRDTTPDGFCEKGEE